MNLTRNPLVDHFRCPESLVPVQFDPNCSPAAGYFRFGDHVTCYGSVGTNGSTARNPGDMLGDALDDVEIGTQTLKLPFDPSQIIDNLRLELYPVAAESKAALSKPQAIRSLYYALRPLMPVAIRKWAQRAYLSGWQSLPFPNWPVDCTVELILKQLFILCLKTQQIDSIPFIWFWPHGKKSCVVITHDVETAAGRDFTDKLMDLDDRHGIKSSFQIIPQDRYEVSPAYLSEIRNRGFEINVHDLMHDGSLFRDHGDFLRQAHEINRFGRQWGAAGFRSGALYRVQQWFDALDFEYDMSVPNVASLEPQRGGCCTVFPYFIGDLLEIPLTATQDYSLFHVLNDYSTAVWQEQMDCIREHHGLISFIVHPDYIIDARPRQSYMRLLGHIDEVREPQELWVTLPGELNRWWRDRQQTTLVKSGGQWTIEGPAKRDARLAFAHVEKDQLVFEIASPEPQHDSCPAIDTCTEVSR